MDRISSCRGCQSNKIEAFFDLGYQPFANGLIKDSFANEKTYPLNLIFCTECSLVQIDYTADKEELFSNYFWVTSTSSTAVDYSKVFCERVLSKFKSEKISYVLEIASNDGAFLKPFKNKGLKVLGVDPAKNICNIANASGIMTHNDFFSTKISKELLNIHGNPSIIFARNVLPHVSNLQDFVEGLSICMNEESMLVLEVHYAGKILDELHYDSIYHEHLCYFSFKSLKNLLLCYNLNIFDIDESPISGGSMVVYVSKNEISPSKKILETQSKEEISLINTIKKWREFAKISIDHKIKLSDIIAKKINDCKLIVGYGASARSSTMLNYCGLDSNSIKKIADQNELKQGLLSPGSHIPIFSPEEVFLDNPDVVLLLAWNFKDEILNILKIKYKFKGEVIIPLPYPPSVENI